MSTSLVVLMVFLGSVMMALQSSIRRKVLKDKAISPLQFTIVAFGGAMVLHGVLYVSLYGWTMPHVLEGFWRVVITGGFINVVIQYFNAKAASYKQGEQSYTQPLQAMTPLLITITAITLGELPSTFGVIGVGCFMVAVYFMTASVDPTKGKWSYLIPFYRLAQLFQPHRTTEEKEKAIVTVLALSAACLGTMGILMDGLYARRGVSLQGILLGATALVGILFGSYLVMYLISPDTKDLVIDDAKRKSAFRFTALHSCSWVAHVLLIWPPFLLSYVAYVGTLKRFSVPLGVLFGYWFFSEKKNFRRRMIAAALTVIGALLISTDHIPEKLSAHIQGLGF